MSSALVLFDIDGTLIRRAGQHHKQALIDAIREVSGLETSLDGIHTQGMLDGDIVHQMMRNAGVEQSVARQYAPQVFDLAQQLYDCPDLRGHVCPGVYDFLDELQQRNIPVGLVTGNLSAIAWRKMEAAGLRRHFRFGAFAEMSGTRADLAAIALRQAHEASWLGPETRVSLIGDHPNDVEAARLNGIRSIAVATGISTYEELAACSPDVLVRDLCSLDAGHVCA